MTVIVETDRNIFNLDVDVIVNAVNTVGIMGCGIALECKKRYPEMYQRYRTYCATGQLTTGKLWLYKHSTPSVLCFPTKEHWQNPSKMEWIESGLDKFATLWPLMGYSSIAFPMLGCGRGNLNPVSVEELMVKKLRPLSGKIYICKKLTK